MSYVANSLMKFLNTKQEKYELGKENKAEIVKYVLRKSWRITRSEADIKILRN